MAENSKIEWTDHTFNPWWGCTKVSPACDHCYAETFAKRTGNNVWGNTAPRRFFGDKHWNEPLKWNAAAQKEGTRKRVFCASMADVFELLHANHEQRAEMDAARTRLWALIEATPRLDWLLLTKRPHNIMRLIPADWKCRCPDNVWMGSTAETQEFFDSRWLHLRKVPAVVRFFSCEPLLGDIWLPASDNPDWIICGGESGPGSRPMHPDWARALRDDCTARGVLFHFKQWGAWQPLSTMDGFQRLPFGTYDPDTHFGFLSVGKHKAGRLLDGRTWDQFPEVANV